MATLAKRPVKRPPSKPSPRLGMVPRRVTVTVHLSAEDAAWLDRLGPGASKGAHVGNLLRADAQYPGAADGPFPVVRALHRVKNLNVTIPGRLVRAMERRRGDRGRAEYLVWLLRIARWEAAGGRGPLPICLKEKYRPAPELALRFRERCTQVTGLSSALIEPLDEAAHDALLDAIERRGVDVEGVTSGPAGLEIRGSPECLVGAIQGAPWARWVVGGFRAAEGDAPVFVAKRDHDGAR